MNYLQFLFLSKNQYNIQSPFIYQLYCEVIAPRVPLTVLRRKHIRRNDKYNQLRFKIADHYNSTFTKDKNSDIEWIVLSDESQIGLIRSPHRDKHTEEIWRQKIKDPKVTLAVDLFYAGLAFTTKKLSKQYLLLR